ncbi:MAG: flippase [Candidatus Colwellbacteria bacterium]|nr:flippase [Candidatus Colwellbacteria bacterium]
MHRALTYNTLISFGTRMVSVILGLFSLGITARLLGVQEFGLYSTALTWAYIISFIADLGLYNLMVREIGRKEGSEEEEVVSDMFTMRLLSLAVFFGVGLLIGVLSPWTFNISLFVIALASLQYGFLSLSQVLMAIFQKHLKLTLPSIAEITGRLLTLGGLLYLFFIRRQGNYELVLVFFSIGALAIFCLNFFWARGLVSFRLRFHLGRLKQLLRQTLPIAASIIFTALYFKLDTLFIAYFRGQTEVGLYNAAYRLLETMIFFPAMFVGILMPQLSKYALTDSKRFKAMFQGAFDIILLFGLPLCLGIFFESKAIMSIIAGKAFLASSGALEILSFGMLMIFFGSLFSNALLALNLQKSLAWIYFTGALFSIGVNVAVIPLWGYIGAAVTTLFTEALVTMLMVRRIQTFVLDRLGFARVPPVLFSSLAMSLFLYATDFGLAVSIFGAVVVYSVSLFATKGITKGDISILWQSEAV